MYSNLIKGEKFMDSHSNTINVLITSYNEEVTGSNNHVKINWPDGRNISFLVDCGLFQESEHNHHNEENFVYDPQSISFVVATHVHTDHVGRLPYLIKKGFNGKIYSSYETLKMMPIVLRETAERLADEYRAAQNEYNNEKLARRKPKENLNLRGKGRKDKPRRTQKKEKGKKDSPLIAPKLIYTKDDIRPCINMVEHKELYKTFSPFPGLEITFYPNAHIGGAVLTVCRAFCSSDEVYFLFTGDLGITNPITKVVTDIPKEVADKVTIIVSESTYGCGNYSKDIDGEREKLISIIKDNYERKGNLIFMSNSLERPQRLAVEKLGFQNDERIASIVNKVPTYLDSSFGLRCHDMYLKLYGNDYLPGNFITIDKEDRQDIIAKPGPKEIICTSPRFYKGSFLNYGAPFIADPNTTLVFIAYITDNIRNIVNLPYGSKFKYAGGKIVKKRCRMETLSYLSSHVSTEELDKFLGGFKNVNTILFNHGTIDSKVNYIQRYCSNGTSTHALLYGKTVKITSQGIKKYY